MDFAQAAEDLEALDDDVWHGGTILTQAGRQEVSRSLSWQLADFLEQAAKVKSFWAAAGSQTDGMTKDFVQRAAELSHALPLAGVWQVCEPLEAEIIAFVHRVCGGGDGDFTHEAAGNFALLVVAVEECMRQAREFLGTLESLVKESRALGGPPVGGPGPPVAGSLQARAVGLVLPGAGLAEVAFAGPLPSAVQPSVCRGN